MKSSSRSRSKQAVTYMEVYGANRVLYRVTASNAHRNQKLSVVYGIFLQDLRSGETAEIHAFSNSLEKTVCFVNDLIQKQVQPYQVYNAALRQLSLEVPFLQNGSVIILGSSEPSRILSIPSISATFEITAKSGLPSRETKFNASEKSTP